MNRMTRLCGRLLSLTLAATTVLSSVPVASMTAYAAEESALVNAEVEEASTPVSEEEPSATAEILTGEDGEDTGNVNEPVGGEDATEPAGGEETIEPETPSEGTTEPAGGEETTEPETPSEGTTEPAGGEETTEPETPSEDTTEPSEDATEPVEDAETGLTEDAEAGLTEAVDETELLSDVDGDETKTYQLSFEPDADAKGVFFSIKWYAPDDAADDGASGEAVTESYSVEDAEIEYNYKTYDIPEGYSVDITVGCKAGATMALQSVTVNGVKQVVWELGANTGRVQQSTFTIKNVTRDTVVGLHYAAKHTSPIGTVLKNADGETLSVSKTSGNERIYAVVAGQEYNVHVTENGEALEDIVAEAWLDGERLENVAIDNWRGVAKFRLNNVYAGKKIELRFYTSDKTYEVERISLQVSKRQSLTDITFKSGVTKGVLSQTTGTTKTYTFTRTPSDSADEIGYYINWDASVDDSLWEYLIEDVSIDSTANQLTLTTGAIAPSTAYATLVFYNRTLAELDGIDTYNPENITDEYVLTSVQLINTKAWTNNAPTVKFSSSTDTTIQFTITPPKGATDLEHGWYYVVAQNTADADDVVYEMYEADGSQPYALQVINEEPGNGHKETYIVTVEYIETLNGWPAEEDIITAGSKTSAEVKMSTRSPYYATSISLKAANSTIYSTRLNDTFALAKVTFGSETTYNNVSDIRITDASGREVTNWQTKYENGYIYITDADGIQYDAYDSYFLRPGKYTLTVAAEAPEDTEPATAKMTFNVVAGIHDFELTTATPVIYKAAGKNASATVSIYYPEWNGTYAPKNKRYTYSYYDPETEEYSSDPSVLLGSYTNAKGQKVSYVTYNNGKVTIDKNYQLPKGKDRVTFTIRADANDYASNVAYDYITFTVKAESSQLGGLVLIDSETNKQVTVGKAGVSIGYFNGHEHSYILQGIVKGATANADGTYDEADLVDTSEYTVTTNNRYVYMQNDMLPCINPGDSNSVINKSVTFTAKSTDGTRTAKLTVKLVPEEPVGEVNACLLSKAAVVESMEIEPPARLAPTLLERGKTIDVADLSPEKGLIIRMDDKKTGEEDYGCLGEGYNYTIQVSGMTVTENGWTEIPYDTITYSKDQLIVGYMLGEKATITVKNGGKVVVRYNLINSDYSSSKAITLSAAKGSKLYYPYYVEQSMVYNAKNVPDTAVSVGVEQLSSSKGYDVPMTGTYDAQTRQLTLDIDRYTQTASNKYAVTFYDQDDKPVTRPVTITINPSKLTTSFKLKTSYSCRNEDTARIQLNGTATNVESVTFNSLRSINVNGQSNGFAYYFTIGSNGVLNLRPIEGLTNKTSKSLSGYVTYTVTYKNGVTETMTTKITVKVSGAPVYNDQK